MALVFQSARVNPPSAPTSPFPLSVAPSGRYLQTAAGTPFLLIGEALWSMEAQCTRAQIDQSLNTLVANGFNAVLFEAFEHLFSSQTPPYVNAEGNAPFTSMSGAGAPYTVDFSTPNPTYWGLVDYIVAKAKSLGIVCLIATSYYGFAGSQEGWSGELTADTSAHLQAYGKFFANRYAEYQNVIVVLGGDNISAGPFDAQIMAGMRSVRTDMIVTGHSARGNDGYSEYSTQAGFNLNSQYSNNAGIVGDAATCYGRNMPFFLIEDEYENAGGQSNQTQRCQKLQSLLSGGCGFLFGCDPMWSFGAASDNFSGLGGISVATCIATYLNTIATSHMGKIAALFRALSWWKLQPQTGTGLVTTTLGTGASAICPALASDNSFAAIFTPAGTGFTVDMTKIGHSGVIARWFDPTNGSYAADAASPLANTGTHAFTVPGTNAAGDADLVLVLT